MSEACAAVERQSSKLAALRLHLAQLSGELSTERDRLKKIIPAHMEALKADFEREWQKVVSAFSVLLAGRREIEALSGSKMDLPEPFPTSSTGLSDDAIAPSQMVEKLEAAIAELAHWRNQSDVSEMDMLPAGMRKPFYPNRVHLLTCPFGNLKAGDVAVEGFFPPGVLARLVARGDAIPADTQDWNDSLMPAQRAVKQFSEEGRLAAESESRGRLQTGMGQHAL